MGLRQNILTDPVSELNLRKVITVKPETTVREAAAKMREGKLGCVVVMSSEGKPVGIFTERKVMRLILECTKKLDEPVSNHLITTAGPMADDSPIGDMVTKMQVDNLRFLAVENPKEKIVSISGYKGLMEYIAEHFPRQIKVQRMKSKMFMDEREGA